MSFSDKSDEPIATVVNGHTFTIDSRYVLKDSRILGKGSFGVVCTAYDSVRKIDIAIKRIRPYANDEWDARHTLREIRLLKLLGPHPNIVSLYELSLFPPKTELYMMMELMDCDLHRVIQSKQPLSEKHHKCFVKQIIEGIKAMHAIGVFHRDLKPGNILVSKDCQVRITDFGLARFMDEDTRRGDNEQNPMTEYVVTRWYRCPELLLSPNRPYSEAIDMWSIGCIVGELLKRKPLFPGKSHAHQVQLIFEVLGYNGGNPSDEMGFPVAGEAASFLEKRCRFRKQPFSRLIPEASSDALRLLEDLLQVNPNKRPSAAQSLEYPFLADAELLNDYGPDYLKKPTLEYFDFEHEKYSVTALKDMIDQEVTSAAANAYRHQPQVTAVPQRRPSLSREEAIAQAGHHQQQQQQQQQQQAQQKLLSAHSVKQMTATDPHHNDNGPASQLATQERRYPSDHDMHNNSNGNLLTAVRNDVGPPGTRGRKSIPKTPSPKQMDMILQKDLQNKRRFSAEQQHLLNAQQQQQANNENQGPARVVGPSAGNPFGQRQAAAAGAQAQGAYPNQRASSFPQGQGQGQGQGVPAQSENRFSKLINSVAMPFPSLTRGIKGLTGGASNAGSGQVVPSSGSGSGGSGRSTGSGGYVGDGSGMLYGAGGPAGGTTVHRSSTMLHNASNVLSHGGGY